jgi:penicillin-binding protein 2
MFDRRVKFVLIILLLPALMVAVRLGHLQLLNASTYREATEKLLEREPRQFPFLRGSITDCAGRVLAYDAPAWDIAVHYGAMVNDKAARRQLCRDIGIPRRELTEEHLDETLAKVGRRIDESWVKISQFTGTPLSEMKPDVDRVVARVRRIKERVSAQRGVDTVVEEECKVHPIVTGLDESQQVAARIGLAEYPWIEVVTSHRRRYAGGTAIGHLVGQVSRVTDEAIADDPNADDPLRCYDSDDVFDVFGVRGVEALAEQWLRGRRGQEHENRLHRQVSPPVLAVNGNDVRLTISMELQQTFYGRLTDDVKTTGACAVLLDIPTRSVIAMVSYPSVDPNDKAQLLAVDPNDPRRPFVFRAVREVYPPGSIVKPMFLAGALADGVISSSTSFNCQGRLNPQDTTKFGCDAVHGDVGPIGAVQESCNVFFYRVGEKMGVSRETWWMQQFGLGKSSGMGLRDELAGHLSTRSGLYEARNVAIGQGETTVTPIQAANMIATVASGEYRPVTLWANDPAPRPAPVRLNVDASAWRVVREGMYRAVNEPRGTAFRKGGLSEPGSYVLLGKTGTAQTPPPEWYYSCRFPDGTIKEILARNQATLLNAYPPERRPEVIAQRKPPEYEDKDHSWFVGYLAPRDRYLQDVTGGPNSVAIAVIVEYAGHGGEVAVPIAAAMLDSVMMAAPELCGRGGS